MLGPTRAANGEMRWTKGSRVIGVAFPGCVSHGSWSLDHSAGGAGIDL